MQTPIVLDLLQSAVPPGGYQGNPDVDKEDLIEVKSTGGTTDGGVEFDGGALATHIVSCRCTTGLTVFDAIIRSALFKQAVVLLCFVRAMSAGDI